MPIIRSVVIVFFITLAACFSGSRQSGSFGGDSVVSFCVMSMRPQCEYEIVSLPSKTFRMRLDKIGVFKKLNPILGDDQTIRVSVFCDSNEELLRTVNLPAGFFPGTCIYIDDDRLTDRARKYRVP
jgi:hypothetical protein